MAKKTIKPSIEQTKINAAREIVKPIIGERKFIWLAEVYQFVSENLTFSQRFELGKLNLSTNHYDKLYKEFLINGEKTNKQ